MEANTMKTDALESSESVRQALLDEASILERALMDVRTKLNVLTHIVKLPPELLAKIFHCYRLTCFDYRGRFQYTCIKVLLLVCRHWRDVAMNSPRLWSIVSSNQSIAGIRACLERSKQHILHIVDEKRLELPEPVQLFLQQASRIRTLELALRGRTLRRALKGFRMQPLSMPELHTLNVSVFRRGQIDRMHDLRLYCDNLRELHMQSCSLSWEMISNYSLLTHLCVDHNPSSTLSPARVLDTLACLPNLVILRLLHFFNGPQEPPTDPPPELSVVHLSNLCEIALRGGSKGCAVVLEQLRTPAQARILLTTNSVESNRDGTALQASLRRKISGVTTLDPPNPALTISVVNIHDSSSCVRIASWPTLEGPDTRMNTEDSPPQFLASVNPTGFEMLLQAFPLSLTEHLFLRRCKHWELSPDILLRACNSCQNTTYLYLSRWDVPDIVLLLGPRAELPVLAPSFTDFRFPSLRELVFYEVAFRGRVHPRGTLAILRPLQTILLVRESAGLRSIKIVFERCLGISDQTLRPLSAHGLVVEPRHLYSNEEEESGSESDSSLDSVRSSSSGSLITVTRSESSGSSSEPDSDSDSD